MSAGCPHPAWHVVRRPQPRGVRAPRLPENPSGPASVRHKAGLRRILLLLSNRIMPQNRFYNAFDLQEWGTSRKADYRSPFQIDRDRIIHAHAFRKLQSKTQVFLSGEYDFYRTRLTHSMEVAQIGRSICHYLCSRGDPLTDDFYIDSDLVEACSLAHDMGHPPFGHAGERTLQELMKRLGGFEGHSPALHLL